MTIKEKIEIIELVRANARELATIFKKEGDKEQYHKYLSETIEIDNILSILTDNKYAEETKKIYTK